MNYNLIPVAVVKEITGATTDAVAQQQGEAVIGILQNFFDLVMVKQDITAEKVTMPYRFSRIIKPRYAPINSVTSLAVITDNGTYKAKDNTALAIGEYSIEVLPRFWGLWHYTILPDAVAAVEISYNAGLFTTWEEVPAVLQEAAQELLKFKFASDYQAGFQSEHIGDYSYSKGNFVKGLPAEIAGMLEGLHL